MAERSNSANRKAGSGAACSRRNEGRTTNMDCLPPEMMMAILAFLSQMDKASVDQVSQRWRSVVNDPTVWRWTKAVLDSWMPEESIWSLAFRRIAHISIQDTLTLAQLQELLKTNTALEFLDLENSNFSHEELTKAFSVTLPHLKTLRLPVTCEDGIYANMSNLEVLYLPGKSITSLTNIVPHLPRLKKFACRGLSWGQDGMDMSILSTMQLPSLTSLCLRGMDHVNDEQIGYMKAGLPNLQSLCLLPKSLSQSGVQELAQITSLKELCWVDCRNEDKLTTLCRGSLQLRVLDIRDSGLEVSATSAQNLARMRSLEELHLSVNKEVLEQLSQGLPHLKKLVIKFILEWGFSDLSVPYLAQMKSLESLQIDTKYLSEESMQELQKGLQNLQSLHVRHSSLSLKHVAGMPKLQELSLIRCSLDSLDVEDLKAASPHLKHLNIEDCQLPEDELRELSKTLQVTETPEKCSRCLCWD